MINLRIGFFIIGVMLYMASLKLQRRKYFLKIKGISVVFFLARLIVIGIFIGIIYPDNLISKTIIMYNYYSLQFVFAPLFIIDIILVKKFVED